MGEVSAIAWTDSTFSPWEGCQRVSPGCANCYAEARDQWLHSGENWGPTHPRLPHVDSYWNNPLRWDRAAAKSKKVHRVFCASLCDVFEQLRTGHPQEHWLEEQRQRLWALIKSTPNLTWMLLTKRPQNIARMVPENWIKEPVTERWNFGWPHNVWIGTTTENREMFDERVRHLRMIPAGVRFISVEPQLEDLDTVDLTGIHWVIQGGESGDNARPFDLAWVDSLRQQCAEQGVAYFFKQAGCVLYDSRESDRDTDEQHPGGAGEDPSCRMHFVDPVGADPLEWKPEQRVQQFPSSAQLQGNLL